MAHSSSAAMGGDQSEDGGAVSARLPITIDSLSPDGAERGSATGDGGSEGEDSPRPADTSSLPECPSSTPECPVCLQPCAHPVRLPCAHVFCYLCVKGVASHGRRRCALCRADIPPAFLMAPELLDRDEVRRTAAPELAIEGKYQWYYEGARGWWQYDVRTTSELEQRYQAGEKEFETMIAGFMYVVDFDNSVQYRRAHPTRRRRIKRDLVDIPDRRGVAGIVCHAERRGGDGGEMGNTAGAAMTSGGRVAPVAAPRGVGGAVSTTVGPMRAYSAAQMPNGVTVVGSGLSAADGRTSGAAAIGGGTAAQMSMMSRQAASRFTASSSSSVSLGVLSGVAVSSGALMSPGTMVSSDVAVSSGTTMSSGATVSSGSTVSSGATVSSGTSVSYGITVSPGAAMSSGRSVDGATERVTAVFNSASPAHPSGSRPNVASPNYSFSAESSRRSNSSLSRALHGTNSRADRLPGDLRQEPAADFAPRATALRGPGSRQRDRGVQHAASAENLAARLNSLSLAEGTSLVNIDRSLPTAAVRGSPGIPRSLREDLGGGWVTAEDGGLRRRRVGQEGEEIRRLAEEGADASANRVTRQEREDRRDRLESD